MKKGKAQFGYYKRYPRDFFEGTVGMPFEVKAAYGLMIDILHMHGGTMVDDAAFLSGMLGLSRKKWIVIKEAILRSGKMHLEGGIWWNGRVDLELGIDRDSAECVAFMSKLSPSYVPAMSRVIASINDAGVNEIKELRVTNQNQNQSHKEEGGGGRPAAPSELPDSGNLDGQNVENREAISLRPALLEAIGADPVNGLHEASGMYFGGAEDIDEVQRWLGLPNITEDVILADIRRLFRKASNASPRTLRYFRPHFLRTSGRLSASEPLTPTLPKTRNQRKSKHEQFDQAIAHLADQAAQGLVRIGAPRGSPLALLSRAGAIEDKRGSEDVFPC